MKSVKLSVLIVGFILLFGSTFGGVGEVFAQQQFIRGDADGDCLVGVLDVDFLICWYAGGGPPPLCMDATDVNDNGVITGGDIVYLINYLRLGGPLPPPPFPDPGFDPTPDGLDCANLCVAPAPSNLDSLIVPSASGFAGDTITVPIVVRNSQDLLAYQLHLEFDPNILGVTEVHSTGGGAPTYFDVDTLSPGVVNISCYIDCSRSRSIPAGRRTLVKIVFQVNRCAPCGATLLDLKNVMGPPFWGNLLDYAGGKVYPTLVDGNLTIERAVPPCIISITDVGNDQGGQVRLNWARCCYDTLGSSVPITEYSVWRRVNQYKGNVSDHDFVVKEVESIGEMLENAANCKYGDRYLITKTGDLWDFIVTVPAMQFSEYSYVAPTLADSTYEHGMYWSVFFVVAHTTDPLVHYDSDPDSGYSLDNILPMPILDLFVDPNSWFTLQWTVPGEYGERPISAYDIRFNTVPVGTDTRAWWDSATACTTGERFFNFIVWEKDSLKVAKDCGCHPKVYFAIKGLDDRPNYSEISNIVRFTCGDANGDGVVNVSDVVWLINYLFMVPPGPPPKPLAAGDVNCDGKITGADVVYLINYLFINGPKPCSSP